jgi:hypothetical protein
LTPAGSAPAGLTADQPGLRARYLAEVITLLYPEPCAVRLPGPSTVDRTAAPLHGEYAAVPSVRRARLLAPMRSRRQAVGAVRRYSEPQSRAGRLKRRAVVAALRSGASGLLLRDRVRVYAPPGADHIESYLRSVLDADVTVSIHIGPARANRKPVLQLLDPAGRTVGYAKLGTNPLTRELVRAETRALTTVAGRGLRALAVPAPLHAGEWRGHEVLVCSALPVWEPRVPLDPDRLAAAMAELATSGGTGRGPLAESRYWIRLRARLAGVVRHEEGRTLAAAARDLVTGAGGTALEYGCWHGDWAPWNMASVADRLLVWDWERFGSGVPVGFDPLHHELQAAIQRDGVPPDRAVVRCLAAAPGLLRLPAAEARLTALLYLTDLATRYLTDRQAEAGNRLGVLGSWLLPELVRAVAELTEEGVTTW